MELFFVCFFAAMCSLPLTLSYLSLFYLSLSLTISHPLSITISVCLLPFSLVSQAFTETQRKRLVSWKQQVLKLLRLFPRKAMLDMPVYRQKG